MPDYETASWAAAVGAALAALAGATAVVLVVRFRRAAARSLESVQASEARSEELLAELDEALRRLAPPHEAVQAALDLQTALDLDEALSAALSAACSLLEADGALISMRRSGEDPVVASFGLTTEETGRDVAALPAQGGRARAVRLDYLYSEDDALGDAFRVTAGLAVRLVDPDGREAGMLAVFWRRGRAPADEASVERFEELARLFGPPLVGAARHAEARRLADRDVVTGLQNPRYFHERLGREVARARRYGRRLGLLLFDLSATETPYTLPEAGERIRAVVRASDVACHLDDGLFAVILPESERGEAGRLLRRLQFTVGARVDSPGERLRLVHASAELAPEDAATAFFAGTLELLQRELDAELARSGEAATA
jgi:two-component system, cell cycle response regulator